MKPQLLALASILLLASCTNQSATNETLEAPDTTVVKDLHTQSNADVINVKHLDLDIHVNFDQKQISGSAIWTIENVNKKDTLKLDTHDLTIDSVVLDGQKTGFSLGNMVEHLGSVLSLPIKENSNKVAIYYKTGKNPRALQWLTPQQTLGKTQPFLYTQSESIYARSWIPCADGPGIRFSYNARVQVPKKLLALMSAENPQQINDSGIYHFKMEVPIPAYLMALAVGDLRFKSVDERTGVYAEPNMLDKAAYELADMGTMVKVAEKIYGPYRWGRYDVLILPPGFPIGGMENPKLTFATPTIIAGDRSLVNLIAHELAHNWSGNLVTNATWNDFWLNEGFTVYFERRISEAMNDKSYSDMLWELGYQDLEAAVEDLGKDSKDTYLKLDLTGRDPDEGLTDIAYEKGALFLKLIENNVGRERFDQFLRKYFDEHAFKTIHTTQFLSYLNANLIKGDKELEQKLNINAWVYGPGIPSNAPRADQARFSKVNSEREKFLSGTTPAQLATKDWTTHEWLHFLRKLPKPLTQEQMKALDDVFHFTQSGNSEIADLWFVISVTADYKPAYPAMEKFLSQVGRRKFLEPLYNEMMKTGKQEMAKTIYQKYRMNYHPLAQMTLDKLMQHK
ncbi:MAG TPA: M1 family metallopeptidase [Flavipsychrobacter sp.]|nr:M1 family metallopeptidase [Flavipsychrobacter sp.]